MEHPRRRFLGWVGGTSLLGAIGLSNPSDHPAPVADTWDMSWTDRGTGKYRAVFDSPGVAEGSALFREVAWCDMAAWSSPAIGRSAWSLEESWNRTNSSGPQPERLS